jgi:hypothetical protein
MLMTSPNIGLINGSDIHDAILLDFVLGANGLLNFDAWLFVGFFWIDRFNSHSVTVWEMDWAESLDHAIASCGALLRVGIRIVGVTVV